MDWKCRLGWHRWKKVAEPVHPREFVTIYECSLCGKLKKEEIRIVDLWS